MPDFYTCMKWARWTPIYFCLVAEFFTSGTCCQYKTTQNTRGSVNFAFGPPFWMVSHFCGVSLQRGTPKIPALCDYESWLFCTKKAWKMLMPTTVTGDEYYWELFSSLMIKVNFSKTLLHRSFFSDIFCPVFLHLKMQPCLWLLMTYSRNINLLQFAEEKKKKEFMW